MVGVIYDNGKSNKTSNMVGTSGGEMVGLMLDNDSRGGTNPNGTKLINTSVMVDTSGGEMVGVMFDNGKSINTSIIVDSTDGSNKNDTKTIDKSIKDAWCDGQKWHK